MKYYQEARVPESVSSERISHLCKLTLSTWKYGTNISLSLQSLRFLHALWLTNSTARICFETLFRKQPQIAKGLNIPQVGIWLKKSKYNHTMDYHVVMNNQAREESLIM